jgi:hypothetical protein
MPPKKIRRVTPTPTQLDQHVPDVMLHNVLSYNNNKQMSDYKNCGEHVMAMRMLENRRKEPHNTATAISHAIASRPQELKISVISTLKRLRDLLEYTKIIRHSEATDDMRASTTNVLPAASPWLMSRIDSVLKLLKETGDDISIDELVEWCKYISSLKKEIRAICLSIDITFKYLNTILSKINNFYLEKKEGKIDLYFSASSQGDNDRVTFDADGCKLIRKGTGARCHTKGARFTMMEVRTRFPPYPSCSVTFPFIPYYNFPCADHLFPRPPPHPVTGHGREQWFDLLQGLRRRSPPRVQKGHPRHAPGRRLRVLWT